MKKKEYKIFLVDDDSKHLVMLKNHLEKKSEYPLDIHIFSNGENCLEKMYENPDIIILDYFLDGIKTDAANGLEILKRIREDHPDTFVIMMSGQDNLQVAVDTIDHGAYDYIIKGESAYLRTQMLIDNIISNINLKKWSAYQKKRETFLIGGVIVLFVIIIVLALIDRGYF